jgi:valyl-tRNA synthetase
MSLEKAYEPAKYEPGIYQKWEQSGAFTPEGNAHLRRAGDRTKTPFSIIMPPPNANGNLHAGHGMYVVDDILTRYKRMQGHPALWLPGTDHAGIETQVVFERKLATEGKSRFDYTPSSFYDAALEFVLQNEDNMLDQMRSMGFSADWSRKQFTLDPKILTTVYDTFKQLVADGHIYRGNRIVNWCPHCRSSFADIELKYREQLDPLYYIKYGPFVLATVRPETKFGDTAIAVNPKDERYKHLIGTSIEAEDLLGPVSFQVIGDDFVSPEFGTGVVKVTPAHDPNDWEMGLRHSLEVKQVIGTDGLLTAIAGKYAGMTVADARAATAHDLVEHGLMDHVDMNYTHSIAYHDRCGTQIEPLVTEQWWLSVAELKKPAIKAIEDNVVQFYPTRFKKQALDWLEGLRDWNIGRQNWFGIRIPVYYNATGDKSLPDYIVATDENEATATYGAGGYEAETDTFDTWFSSGQWPYATLMATADFEQFYPTSVMGTMRDILYHWVTRMIMFGIYKTKDMPGHEQLEQQVPFRQVYLWGAVNDAAGKKMSKSKGNVINPLEMTAQYGTDALRLALTIGVTPGTGGSLAPEKIEGYRNFCNKLWNVARFVLGKLDEGYKPGVPSPTSLADKWIMDKLSVVTDQVTADLDAFRLSEAGQAVYSLVWNDFADWYIEASKAEANLDMLVHVLENILKLAHPFAPFVTEAIWTGMPSHSHMLIVSAWPEAGERYEKEAMQFEVAQEVIRSSRVGEITAKDTQYIENLRLTEEQLKLINSLSPNLKLSFSSGDQSSTHRIIAISVVEKTVDPKQLEEQRTRIAKNMTENLTSIALYHKQLQNDRLPDHIRSQIQARYDEALLLKSRLDEQLEAIR